MEEQKRKAYLNSPEYKRKQRILYAKLLNQSMKRAAEEAKSKSKLEEFHDIPRNNISDDEITQVRDLPSPVPAFDEGIKTEHIQIESDKAKSTLMLN